MPKVMDEHIVSRQRVIDHGEVYTPPGLVNDMLDLVAHECERIDSRFLEPACGNGNFLTEVLRRRLTAVGRKCRKSILRWEQDALLGLACLYGIELLYDNVNECRDRLHAIFHDAYTARFKDECRRECSAAARVILRSNIVQGDALKMTMVAHDPNEPMILTQWAMLPGGRFKRQLYEYRELTGDPPGAAPSLFAGDIEPLFCELGKPVFIARPVGELPLVHYLELGLEEKKQGNGRRAK